jgi:hypothetical protein
MFHIPVTDRLNKRRPCVQKTIGRSGTLFCHFLLILVHVVGIPSYSCKALKIRLSKPPPCCRLLLLVLATIVYELLRLQPAACRAPLLPQPYITACKPFAAATHHTPALRKRRARPHPPPGHGAPGHARWPRYDTVPRANGSRLRKTPSRETDACLLASIASHGGGSRGHRHRGAAFSGELHQR